MGKISILVSMMLIISMISTTTSQSQIDSTISLSILGTNILSAYDFIIVGSGSSGSIVADRLSEKGYSVLILEAGVKSIGALGGQDIVGTKGSVNPANFEYTPNRTVTSYDVPLFWQKASITGPRWNIAGAGVAKVVGGGGVHNGMVFQRGKMSDYNNWNVSGWNWTNIEPYFKKIETIMDPNLLTSPIHGHDGRIKVGVRPLDQEGANFISSCNASGLPFNDDFQKDYRDGCGYFQFNIDENGERSSSAHEYLVRATKRSNVKLLSSVTVTRVRWSYNLLLGRYEATGVDFVINASPSTTFTVTCSKEVILAGGSLNTPKILMNSGVGNSTYLAQFSSQIPTVVRNLPGVGRNLNNHFLFFSVFGYNDTSNTRPTFYELFGVNLQYSTQGTGIFSTPGYSVGVWLRPNATGGEAENVMIVQPGVIGTATPFKSISLGISIAKPKPNNHFLTLNPNQSGSRTDFFLRPPIVNFTLLNNNEDVATLVRGFKEAKRIMSYPPMSNFVYPVTPPATVVSDADIENYVRTNTVAHEHWSGTCKMGSSSDPMAVVDNRLRVIGVGKIRVVDASIMPSLPHSLVHATVMAVAEKAADLIIQDYNLF